MQKPNLLKGFSRIGLLALSVMFTLQSTTAFAGGGRCEEIKPKKAHLIMSHFTAQFTVDALEQLDAEAKTRGEELLVAVVGRMGTDPGKAVPLPSFGPDGKVLTPKELLTLAYHTAFAHGKHNYSTGSLDSLMKSSIKHAEFLGSLESKKGRTLKYSHVGLVFKNHPKGQWGFVHELNPCSTAESNLYDEDMQTFFLDTPYDYGAQIMVPPYEMQKRIQSIVFQKKLAWNFKGPIYNAIADRDNADGEQNSNQFVLEVMAAATRPVGQVTNRAQAQQILRDTQYEATWVKVPTSSKYAMIATAREFLPKNVRLHSENEIKLDPYEAGEFVFPKGEQPLGKLEILRVATVLSINEWMQRNKLMVDIKDVYLPKDLRIKDDEPDEKTDKPQQPEIEAATKHN